MPASDSFCASNATIQSNPVLDPIRCTVIIENEFSMSPDLAPKPDLYFFQIVKEQNSR